MLTPSDLSVADAVVALGEERDAAAPRLAAPPLAVVTMSAIAWWNTRDDDYRLVGLMGSAAAIGLGLAIGCPDREVWVIDGDGSVLMQLGVLTAIADAAPPNLTHVVIDNGMYAISGGQPTPGERDWAALFLAAGYAHGAAVSTAESLRTELGSVSETGGPRGIAVHCQSVRPDYPPGAFAVRPIDEANRIRAALSGSSSATPPRAGADR